VAADSLEQAITSFIERQTGGAGVRVERLRRLTGGASRETWSLDATLDREGATETLPLILQRDTRGSLTAMTRETEFNLLRTSYDAGVAAPEPLWLGDETLGGASFFVRRIDGETLPRRLLRDDAYAQARDAIPGQLAQILAAVHAIPTDARGVAALPQPPEGASPALTEVDRHEQVYRSIAKEPHPAFELAFRWLRSTAPETTADGGVTLVHGDYRMGNVLFGPEGVRAVLDWELAHTGDPMEDIGWLCVRSWRFGGRAPVGGIGEREPFFAAYETAGGRRVDPQRVRWWEAFGNLRWGIICLGQARVYLDGHSDSVELASIGRRTAETEWELLRLMEQ
jgi:aminoglycoside phosphotransferase (APT) family kinase protein